MRGSWTAADIADQDGRVAIVTGANSGIGFETARELARKGATVVLTCRSEGRGDDARNRIRAELPDAGRPRHDARPRRSRPGPRIRHPG
jgi:NAD(P)-dependent dehydrogenase (short-subunit alcohol dehydrogenase family)